MNRGFLKTAAFLLIFALIAALPAGFARGEGARLRVLKNGDSGEDVVSLQRDLRALTLLDFSGEPSGEFGDEVELAVMELQRILGVEVDGIYGANTSGAFLSAVESGLLTPSYIEELPLYGCVIGVDAGHQGEADLTLEPIAPGSMNKRFAMTEGCFGIRTQSRESIINLDVSQALSKLLKSFGAEVVTSRESEDVSISNSARAVLMNESGVDFWLRIHCDHSSDPSLFGARILLPNSICNFNISAKSALLGKCVIENYCDTVGTIALTARSLTTETGFNWSAAPVAALELGYLSNAATDLALSTPEYREKCADGILLGIAEYCLKAELIELDAYLTVLRSMAPDAAAEPGGEALPLFDSELIKNPGILRSPLLSCIK
ncbi:MAG: N-acetylmuramoyl-L-alanine amidase [Clostridia bacterium]|nr:N-acetylmuramoyl-L-alanine amidase [Clostridia bacterium]